MPKPAHTPTSESRSLVERLASIGIPQDKIADVVGLSGPTLRKHYREHLDGAALRANAAVADYLFKMATGDGPRAVTAAIFWMKTRAGWRENVEAEQADAIEIGRAMADALIEMDRVTLGDAYDPVASANRRMEERERERPIVLGPRSDGSKDDQNH